MFERFTDRARRVVVLAQEEARLLNHNYIGTEHILLGLLNEGEGIAAQALESLDIDLASVRDEVVKIIGQGQQSPSGHIPFTPRAKKVLELSLREALQLGHNYIGTEHILLGLIREGEGVAAQVLQQLGAELQKVRQEVNRLLLTVRDEDVTLSKDLTLGEHIAEFVDLNVPASQYEEVEICCSNGEPDPRAGCLTVELKWVDGGRLDYRGVHHPDVVCEGKGVCIHCGRTLDFGT